MVQFAQSRPHDKNDQLLRLVTQLEHHIKSCLAGGGVPQESDRQRLRAFIDALREVLTGKGTSPSEDSSRTRPRLTSSPEVLLITPDEKPPLATKLESAGYRVRAIANLADVERRLHERMPAAIHERMPAAILLDVDFPEGSEKTLALISGLRAQINLRAPLLVCSERNDMTARLEAVRVGGAAYFDKPIDHDVILEALAELLLPQTAENYYRVLIVNDRPTEAWEMAGALEEQGMTPLVVMQPLQILQDIHPDITGHSSLPARFAGHRS